MPPTPPEPDGTLRPFPIFQNPRPSRSIFVLIAGLVGQWARFSDFLT